MLLSNAHIRTRALSSPREMFKRRFILRRCIKSCFSHEVQQSRRQKQNRNKSRQVCALICTHTHSYSVSLRSPSPPPSLIAHVHIYMYIHIYSYKYIHKHIHTHTYVIVLSTCMSEMAQFLMAHIFPRLLQKKGSCSIGSKRSSAAMHRAPQMCLHILIKLRAHQPAAVLISSGRRCRVAQS
jgi:hypothetical protein